MLKKEMGMILNQSGPFKVVTKVTLIKPFDGNVIEISQTLTQNDILLQQDKIHIAENQIEDFCEILSATLGCIIKNIENE